MGRKSEPRKSGSRLEEAEGLLDLLAPGNKIVCGCLWPAYWCHQAIGTTGELPEWYVAIWMFELA